MLFWISGEDLCAAVGFEDDHIVGILFKSGDIHARRTGRHSANSDTDRVRAFFQ